MRRYETSIKQLMKAKTSYFNEQGGEPIFLSNWDADYESVSIPSLRFNEMKPADLQKYFFWTDEANYRINIQNFFSQEFNSILSKDDFAIATNGTSCIMIALSSLKESGKHNILIFTPIYFSTLNLLDELDFNVIEFNLSMQDNFYIDMEKMEEIVKKNQIDTIILTNPLFGCGVELMIDTISNICTICNKYGICFVMDYVYGGMEWSMDTPKYYIFNYPVYKAIKQAEQYIFIESISKRIFLNGSKFALIFSSSPIMRRVLRLSVFMVGSMSAQQVNLVPQIYSSSSVTYLAKLISKNAQNAFNNYRIITSLLIDTPIEISKTNCGYFSLLSLPKKPDMDDTNYALDILKKSGVLTTPHSRYLFGNRDSYSFRINLLLNRDELFNGLTKIKNLV